MPEDADPASSSGTANWIAAARARESERADRLFSDPYAIALAGSVGRYALEASERAAGGENQFLPIRTRFFDDVLEAEVDKMDQVVLLGAGFDTRAFRLGLPERLNWFEVDRRDLIREKERILSDLGAVARCRRAVVAADLTRTWSKPLLDAGFVVGLRTAWLAEGLFFYLSEEVVWRLLAKMRSLSADGSLVLADVFGSGLLRLPAMQPSLLMRVERGQPPPFTSDDPGATFNAAGWPSVRLALPGRLGVAYGRPFGRVGQLPELPDPNLQSYLVVARIDG